MFVYLFAHWHSTTQAGSEADDFCNEGLEGEILLQDYTSQDGFQLRNTRTCQKRGIKDDEDYYTCV